jgi:beta propeller domain-containing protein
MVGCYTDNSDATNPDNNLDSIPGNNYGNQDDDSSENPPFSVPADFFGGNNDGPGGIDQPGGDTPDEMCEHQYRCPDNSPNPSRFDDTECKDTEPEPEDEIVISAALVEGLDCEEGWNTVYARLVSEMEDSVNLSRDWFLKRIENREYCFTTCTKEVPCEELWGGDADADADSDSDSDSDCDGGGEFEDGASEYSETNNQVLGVDEADFIKNDASHFYILADNRFQILDVWPPQEAQSLSGLAIEGTPKKMYVHANRALIYSSLGPIPTDDPAFDQTGGDCTYGYDCDFVGDGNNLKITLLDISDKTDPKILRETIMNGSYVNSRRIGDAVFTAVVYPSTSQEYVDTIPKKLANYAYKCADDIPFGTCEIKEMFEQLKEENRQLLLEHGAATLLPEITDTRHLASDGTPQSGPLGSCSDLHISAGGDGQNQLAITSVDMTKEETIHVSYVTSRPGAVYADADSLYVAVRHYRHQTEGWYESPDDEISAIHKFALDPVGARSSYLASGFVKGRVLNQFAMDEHEGHLRIATTSGHVPSSKVHSTLSVLAENDGVLETVGQLDNIAPTEDIRSVRFRDDAGFIVTFKKTDPLFAIDLSVPEAPSIEGELKIPGYSTYMHFLDEDHLLTIGFDAEEVGSFAWFQGIQLQIIDVADLTNPKLLHKEIIGTRGSTSDAATDHLAFNYYAPKNMLAIPMQICEGSSGGGDYANKMTFGGLMVYKTTVEEGFDLIGRIAHSEPETDYDYSSSCNNWWTSGNSKVKRSVFMDDFVYSVAPDLINVSALSDLGHLVSSIDLID